MDRARRRGANLIPLGAVVALGASTVENVPGITIRALACGSQIEGLYTWETWTRALYTERVKDGANLLAKAFGDTGSG